jgi:uncharacterized protein (DUF1330 family)
MPAYIIALRTSTTDPAELATYGKTVRATFPASLKALAAYGKHETLEGPPIEGAVLLEFPTYEEARAWYDSPSYQDARAHRLRGAEYQFVLVQGV